MSRGMKNTLKVIFSIVVIIVIILLLLRSCGSRKYDVTFKDNNKSLFVLTSNGKIIKPRDPVKKGYRFAGWYLGDELFDFDTKISGDIVLHAKWEGIGKNKITFDFNDGKNKSTLEVEGSVRKPGDPLREGYKFIGWYNGNKLFDFDSDITEDITLVAKWEKQEEQSNNSNNSNSYTNNSNKPSKPRKHVTQPIPRDTIKPVITNFSGTTISSKIVITLEGTDNRTSSNKLIKQYSIDGINYQNTNTFNNLVQNTLYTVYVKIKDEAGNEVIETKPFTTKKVDEVLNPVQNITTLTNKDVEVTVDSSIYKLEVSTDNINFSERLSNKVVIGQNGTYYLRHTDEAGNKSGVKQIVITNIDKEAPQPFTININKTSRKIVINGNTTDNVTSPANLVYKYSIDGENYQDSNEFDNLVPKTYKCYVKAIDEAGNERIVTKEVEIEKLPDVNYTLSTTSKTNQNVLITFTNIGGLTLQVKENDTWVNKTSPYTVESNKTLTFRYSDGFNIGKEKTIEINNIDKVKPVLTINKYDVSYDKITVEVEASDLVTPKNKLKIEYSVDDGAWTTSNVLDNLEVETNYKVKVRVTDEAGNIEEIEKDLITLAAPDVGEIRKSTEELTKDNVNLTVVDKNPHFKLEYSINNLPFEEYTGGVIPVEDNYKVVFRYVNNAGNPGREKEVQITNIDKVLPVISASISNTTEYSKEVSVTLNATDNVEVKSFEYGVSNSSTVKPALSKVNGPVVINNKTGKYYIHTKAEDKVGNIKEEVYGPYLLDNEAPEVLVKLDGTTSNKIKLKVEATDTEAGIKGYYYSRDGGNTYSHMQTSGIYMYTRLKNNTEYKIRVKVEDNLGNVKESEIKTIKTAPLGKIAMTIDDDRWSNKKTLSINSDQIAGETYSYSIDNGLNWIVINGATASAEVNKNMTVKYKVSDGVNEEISDIEVEKIDPIKPTITRLEEVVSEKENGSITFEVEAEDTGDAEEKSGIDKYSYSIDGINWSAWEEHKAKYKIENLKADTVYKVRVRVKDKAGNVSERNIDIKTKNECFAVASNGYITGYDFAACPKDVVIPTSQNGKNIIGINAGIFQNKGITSVKFNEGLKDIQARAFKDNPINQSELILPASLQTIGNNAFDSTTAEYGDLVIKGSTNIGDSAFQGATLNSLDLGNTTGIEQFGFKNIKLRQNTLILPHSLIKAGPNSFRSPDIEIENLLVKGDTTIGVFAFNGVNVKNAKFEGESTIEYYSFTDSKLKTVDFGEKTKSIGNHAFGNTELTMAELTIPSSVQIVGTSAFYSNNKKIGKLVLGAKIVENQAFALGEIKEVVSTTTLHIKEKAFNNTGIEKLEFSNNIKQIDTYAFNNNKLNQDELVIPESITSMGIGAFATTNQLRLNKLIYKTSAPMPQWFMRTSGATSPSRIGEAIIEKAEKIGLYALTSVGLEKLTLGEGIKEIKDRAFAYNPIVQDELVIPASVEKMENLVFLSSSKNIRKLKVLTKAPIPNGAFMEGTISEADLSETTEIGDSAFSSTNIEKVKLSDKLEKIGNTAFNNNKLVMDELIIPETLKEAGGNMFASRTKHIKKVVWASKIPVPYRAFWGARIDDIVITQAEELKDLAFYENHYTTVDLGPNMKKIGQYGIGYNRLGTTPTIIIPSTIEEINKVAFWALKNGKLIVKKAAGTIPNAPWGALNTTTVEYQG